MTDTDSSVKVEVLPSEAPDTSRRRFVGAGVAATPILAALSARPTFADTSSGHSGDASTVSGATTGGFNVSDWAEPRNADMWRSAGFDFGKPDNPKSGSEMQVALQNGDTRYIREVLTLAPESDEAALVAGILNASFFDAQPGLASYILSVEEFHAIHSGAVPHPAPYGGLTDMIRSQFS